VIGRFSPPMCFFILLMNESTSCNLHCFTDSRQKFAFVGWSDGGYVPRTCPERCAGSSPNSRATWESKRVRPWRGAMFPSAVACPKRLGHLDDQGQLFLRLVSAHGYSARSQARSHGGRACAPGDCFPHVEAQGEQSGTQPGSLWPYRRQPNSPLLSQALGMPRAPSHASTNGSDRLSYFRRVPKSPTLKSQRSPAGARKGRLKGHNC
jgi:hypothetical protein